MSAIWEYLQLTWAWNFARLTKRSLCCEQRHRWTPSLVSKVRDSTDNKCFYCRTTLNIQGNLQTRMHIDHYWPWSKGGANLFGNLVPACARCNLKKSNLRPTTFMVKNKSVVKPFCRYLSKDNKYCVIQPASVGHKYCRRHGFLHPC